MKNIYDKSNIERVKEVQSKKELIYKEKIKGLSVVILNLDKPEFIIPLLDCLLVANTFFTEAGESFEVLIGDTGSSNPKVLHYYKTLEENFIVVKNLKYHFSQNNNYLATTYAQYKSILFLNNDTLLDKPENLYQIYSALNSDTNIGIAGAVLLFQDKSIQHAGISFFEHSETQGMFPYHPLGNENYDAIKNFQSIESFAAVTGAFLMIKWDLFFYCQGFDEFYEKEAQDVDLCLKIKRMGYKTILTNFGIIYHYENGTRKKGEECNTDRIRFIRKWSNFIRFGLQI